MKRTFCLFLLIISTFCQIALCRAEIVEFYPGLDALVKRADTIAVVQVGSSAVFDRGEWRPPDYLMAEVKAGRRIYDSRWGSRSGIYQPYFVTSLRTLKGSALDSTQTLSGALVSLCTISPKYWGENDSETDIFIRRHSQKISSGELALVFLTRSQGEGIQQGRVPFKTLNCPGSAIAISDTAAKANPKGNTPLETVRNLLGPEMRRKEKAILSTIIFTNLR